MDLSRIVYAVSLGGALVALAPEGQAQAQYDPYAPSPMVETVRDQSGPLFTDFGLGVAIGGGVTNFTNSYLNSITDIGGSWNALITLGTRSPVAFEGQYIGSAQGIHSNGLSSGSVFISNGASGDIRINILPYWAVTPYIFGGLGWRRYSITNNSFNTSGINNRSDVVEVPVGGGIALRYHGLIVDGRFDYRFSFYDSIASNVPEGRINNPDAANSGLQNWNATARIGMEF